MSIQLKMGLAIDAYKGGSPRLAVSLLREAADLIEKEADLWDAYRFDADGLKEHQESRADDVRYEDIDDRD